MTRYVAVFHVLSDVAATDMLELLPSEKGAAIVLYFPSGRISEITAGELAALGYTNVTHVEGGKVEWEKDGQSVVG
jgi:rhodanese-related sulfurtransferase